MEASDSTPPAEPTRTPPPPADPVDDKAGRGWRLLAAALALALAFAAAVMIIAAVDVNDLPLENELGPNARPGTEYYDGSSTEHTLTTAAFFVSGGLAAIAALLAIAITITGRFTSWLWLTTGAAIVVGVGAIVLNNV